MGFLTRKGVDYNDVIADLIPQYLSIDENILLRMRLGIEKEFPFAYRYFFGSSRGGVAEVIDARVLENDSIEISLRDDPNSRRYVSVKDIHERRKNGYGLKLVNTDGVRMCEFTLTYKGRIVDD